MRYYLSLTLSICSIRNHHYDCLQQLGALRGTVISSNQLGLMVYERAVTYTQKGACVREKLLTSYTGPLQDINARLLDEFTYKEGSLLLTC